MTLCIPASAPRSRHSTPLPALADHTPDGAERAAAVEEFRAAMQQYKHQSGRQFPTWSEVLEVLKGLGYQKANPAPPGPRATPLGVRGARRRLSS